MLVYIRRRNGGNKAKDVSVGDVIGPVAQDGVDSAATSAVGLHLPAISNPRWEKAFRKRFGLHIPAARAEIGRTTLGTAPLRVIYSQLGK